MTQKKAEPRLRLNEHFCFASDVKEEYILFIIFREVGQTPYGSAGGSLLAQLLCVDTVLSYSCFPRPGASSEPIPGFSCSS